MYTVYIVLCEYATFCTDVIVYIVIYILVFYTAQLQRMVQYIQHLYYVKVTVK